MTNRERARKFVNRNNLPRYVGAGDAMAPTVVALECMLYEVDAEARAEEREACAALVRERALEGDYSPRSELARAAAAIRNRGGE
jgi:hypothetical protein